ncbi:MAG: hypothetical protein COX48_04615 [bacterium (Candidatus Stahlbacteria) CG23_combo_of_CG06-09_8_20_14_all_34_7]|nr:MAG: hypothetical protein COX48_04615 [bacterium (Candidatus Stahlbacteria) CG23_combo_of_CG06-09_8_20_14_all_34_7]
MKEITVLYYPKKLKRKYSDKFITKMQDVLVSTQNTLQFIETDDTKKEKVKRFILSECKESIILLIGGEDTFPFEKNISHVDDGDSYVCTDNWWVSSGKDCVIPEIEISRMPDGKDGTENSFLEIIEKSFTKNKISVNEKIGITAEIWKSAANDVFKHLQSQGDMLVSPPHTCKSRLNFEKFEGGLYFNLHGSEDEKGWYGQRDKFSSYKEEYPLAVIPENISKGIKNGFVLSEACYGAYINNKKKDESIMLTALGNGISFCIGSTSTAYGTFTPPLSEADLLVSIFYDEFLKNKNASLSFLNAKRIFAQKNIERNGFLDDDDKKTLVEFVMYGNPMVEVSNK